MSAPVVTVLVHGVVGTLTAALAIWIIASWRLQQSLKHAMPKKKAMCSTLILWVITIILAVLCYPSVRNVRQLSIDKTPQRNKVRSTFFPSSK